MITSKICTICNQEKNIELFYFYKHRQKHGIRCIECLNKQSRDYKLKNKEKVTVAHKKYYLENKNEKKEYAERNKEIISKRQKQYREDNKKLIKENMKKYYSENREYLLQQKKEYLKTPFAKASQKNKNHKRRTLTKQGDVTSKQILNLQQTTKVCYWCGMNLKNVKVHLDHYTPLSKGGEHTISNLVISCYKCNIRKKDKDPIYFANSVGKLF